jgi:hypothetical protein
MGFSERPTACRLGEIEALWEINPIKQ